MAHDDDKALSAIADDSSQEANTLIQQLADAKREIDDLKLQLMWMERSYE